MRKIDIFLASSEKLAGIREKTADIILRLGRESYLSNVNLKVKDCTNIGNNQNEYNRFIDRVSDLAFFFIDSEIGLYTLEELVHSCISQKKTHFPKVYVFYPESLKNQELIRDIQGLVMRTTDQYCQSYLDEHDLEKKIKGIVLSFKTSNCPRWIARAGKTLLNLLPIICFTLACLYASIRIYPSKEDVLLLVGGGTLEGYFYDNYDIDISKQTGMVYVPMASKSAWSLLYEEISKLEYQPDNSRPYYPMILSSKRAFDNDFVPEEQRDVFLQVIGHIIELPIGRDTLQTSISGDLELGGQTTITDRKLASLLKDKQDGKINLNVFTTTKGKSGTYNQYKQILAKYDCNLDDVETKVFYRKQKTDYFDDGVTPYIVLGSKGYGAVELKESPRLNVVDTSTDDHFCITNELYAYICAYKYHDYYIIRKCVSNFLGKVGFKNFPHEFKQIPSSKIINTYDPDSQSLVTQHKFRP